ncbi:QUALITY PROTEIN: disintegrin and metalloproteinase domain-containing 12-like [Octopus vulgaris]|uniref:QUALITY PROTEIN: disintegrin and metalloproteinase domain-containing 12-like n=1 Tax=Octopus vulgaris TaxID=6645 RepID=A0AA36BFF5_OCTVU|nr:QUALITY PROTEIN: disintegrin and metalloproteinase domain-containing 12-like [Octopus vulgaris]
MNTTNWTLLIAFIVLNGIIPLLFSVEARIVTSNKHHRVDTVKHHNHSYEIVQPQIYHKGHLIKNTFNEKAHVENISIVIPTHKKKFVLKLKKNSELISNRYISRTLLPTGFHSKKISKDEYYAQHCYYNGHIEGDPYSIAAVSTCDGISGLIIKDDGIYHIEPAGNSLDPTLHYWYKNMTDETASHCGNDAHDYDHKDIHELFSRNLLKRVRRSIRGPYGSNKDTRYVELYLVADSDTHNQHKDKMERRLINIANTVNMIYRPLNLYIGLVGVEIWRDPSNIPIKIERGDPQETLTRFLHYRQQRINPVQLNDNAQLLVGFKFANGVIGKASQGKICMHQSSGGVNSDHFHSTVASVAMTVAHELGHNLGMLHDRDTCVCPGESTKCIMEATSGDRSSPKWSSCSKEAIKEAFEMGMDYCLYNKPESLFYTSCGNNFVEDLEECDCGLPEVCDNKCCDPTTCKLKGNAVCATGKCCNLNTCQLRPPGTACRPREGECDLDEYCTGKGEYCPENVFIHNGRPCSGGLSYCYKGQCNTHTKQCRLLWGETGRVSDDICFKSNNVHGNVSGNCGFNWQTDRYTACAAKDVRCGMLHCVHKNEKLMFWKDNLAKKFPTSFINTGRTIEVCRAVILDVGLQMQDPGLVPDGSKCGDEKICVEQQCKPLQKLGFPDCPKGCNGHGVCNSRGNCHCDAGYGPPYCDKEGKGGSVDSGIANLEKESPVVTIVLVILFLVVIISVLVCAYLRRNDLIQCWKKKSNFNMHFPPALTNLKLPKVQIPTRTDTNRQSRTSRLGPPISKPMLTHSTNSNSQALVTPVEAPQDAYIPKREPRSAARPLSAIMTKDISSPVLLSTTNRRSAAFSEQNLPNIHTADIKGGLATTKRPVKLRRNHSDRPQKPPPLKPDESRQFGTQSPKLRPLERNNRENAVSQHLLGQDDEDALYMNTSSEPPNNSSSIDHNSNHAVYHNMTSPSSLKRTKEKPPRPQARAMASNLVRSESNPTPPKRDHNPQPKTRAISKLTQTSPSASTADKPVPVQKNFVNLNRSESDPQAKSSLTPAQLAKAGLKPVGSTTKKEHKSPPPSTVTKPVRSQRITSPTRYNQPQSSPKEDKPDYSDSNNTESKKKISELRQMFDSKI